ncbi:bifunctional helix-turn-helix transcriptional regulator/GNAT family N-acetyltransferase [Novosphingobium sp. 1949]|uniref:Bifunctional helix-turn-helix transcriptional regulator/GNAT family N-acetyltransferase n=1 Tax=Novosphingobium organovorum TaxID=2930092 RepID=A0ABT0B904_9SPHN|nr:bifunctional helix-turn-helix transcriptional regulator/GNAT family N-acetyltransferase [Novosphingobium organovorum]MCJ2181541.1 bifunctional helix-turn-helix transcriptional regulator/GNAT family N-acetyltransferase [Novosphingobium organovorum]
MGDIVAELGGLFLGTRLKRLGERLQADAARIIEGAQLPLQPAHMPLITALSRAPGLTVGQLAEEVGFSQPGVTRSIGQLVEAGLVEARAAPGDQRQRELRLTGPGEAAMERVRTRVFAGLDEAVAQMCGGKLDQLLALIGALEAALAETSMVERHARLRPRPLAIRAFEPALARAFHDINAQWIEAMFRLEPTDREVLENPQARLIEPGGAVLFVESEGLGIVGTCALQKTGPDTFELTKMGVLESARGLKAGEFLLRAMIAKAHDMGAKTLYLLTNARCEAAIHLYEKLGFVHDRGIMERYGARYQRCDVAMLYRG